MEFLDDSLRPYPGRGSRSDDRRRAGVFVVLVATLVTAILGTGAVLTSAFSGSTLDPDTFVATYERADGTTIPVRDVTCATVARDLLALGRPVSGSGRDWAPAGLGKPYPVKDDVAAVAALPKGGTLRHLLTCDTRARWLGGDVEKVRFSINIYGGKALATGVSLRVR